MQNVRHIVVLLAVTIGVGGCQQPANDAGRMQYPGLTQLAKSREVPAGPLREPKILPKTHFAAGLLFEQQGNVGKAITQYRKATALNHNYMVEFHRLGRMYSLAGKHNEAIRAIQRATQIKPDNAILQNDLSFEYMFANRWQDAEKSLRRAIALRPTMARAHINLALVLGKQKRFDDALATFRQVLPEADAYYNLGLLYRGNKKYVEAASAFRHVLEMSTEFAAAQSQLDEIASLLPVERQPEPEASESAVAVGVTIPAPRLAEVDAQHEVTKRDTREADVTTKKTVAPSGHFQFADAERSVEKGTAARMRDNQTPRSTMEVAETNWPTMEEMDVAQAKKRAAQIDAINVMLDAPNAVLNAPLTSSKLPLSTTPDADWLANATEADCDDFEMGMATTEIGPTEPDEWVQLVVDADEEFAKTPTQRAPAPSADTLHEIERMAYMTEEEFVELEPIDTQASLDTMARYEDYLTDEEFIEPADAAAVSSVARFAHVEPTPRYENFLTDEEFVEETVEHRDAKPEAYVASTNKKTVLVDPRIDWNNDLVTLEELVEIMDNERRCFEETEFADVAPTWPIVDSLAYSPVEFEAPRFDPWAEFLERQTRIDQRADKVTTLVRQVRSFGTDRKLAQLESSLAAMTEHVTQRKEQAKQLVEARRQREQRQAEAARAQAVAQASKRRRAKRTEQRDAMAKLDSVRRDGSYAYGRKTPTVGSAILAGPYGPPASAQRKTAFAESTPQRRATRRTPVIRHGIKLNWRDGFRKIHKLASIVGNDVVCLNASRSSDEKSVAATPADGNTTRRPEPKRTSSRALGSPFPVTMNNTRRD